MEVESLELEEITVLEGQDDHLLARGGAQGQGQGQAREEGGLRDDCGVGQAHRHRLGHARERAGRQGRERHSGSRNHPRRN